MNLSPLLQPFGGFDILFSSIFTPKIEEVEKDAIITTSLYDQEAIRIISDAVEADISFWQSVLPFLFWTGSIVLFLCTYLILSYGKR